MPLWLCTMELLKQMVKDCAAVVLGCCAGAGKVVEGVDQGQGGLRQ